MDSKQIPDNFKKVSDNIFFKGQVEVDLGISSLLKIFKRMLFKKCPYISSTIKTPRTCNSYIQLKNEKFIKILYFIHNPNNGQNECVSHEINVIEHDLCTSLFICISVSHVKIIFVINLIDNMCVFMTINNLEVLKQLVVKKLSGKMSL